MENAEEKSKIMSMVMGFEPMKEKEFTDALLPSLIHKASKKKESLEKKGCRATVSSGKHEGEVCGKNVIPGTNYCGKHGKHAKMEAINKLGDDTLSNLIKSMLGSTPDNVVTANILGEYMKDSIVVINPNKSEGMAYIYDNKSALWKLSGAAEFSYYTQVFSYKIIDAMFKNWMLTHKDEVEGTRKLVDDCKKIFHNNQMIREIVKSLRTTLMDPSFEGKINSNYHLFPCYMPGNIPTVINLKEGIVRQRKTDDYFSKSCNSIYYSDAKDDKIEMKEVDTYFNNLAANRIDMDTDDEKKNFIIQLCMKCLIGGQSKLLFQLLGEGNSGKSLLMKLLKNIFQPFVIIGNCELISYSGRGNGPNENIMDLNGINMYLIDDIKAKVNLDMGKIKGLTGGTETRGRGMYKSNTTIEPRSDIAASFNVLPTVDIADVDTAVMNRIALILFINQFLKNNKIEEEYMQLTNYFFTYIVNKAIAKVKKGESLFIDPNSKILDEGRAIFREHIVSNDMFLVDKYFEFHTPSNKDAVKITAKELYIEVKELAQDKMQQQHPNLFFQALANHKREFIVKSRGTNMYYITRNNRTPPTTIPILI